MSMGSTGRLRGSGFTEEPRPEESERSVEDLILGFDIKPPEDEVDRLFRSTEDDYMEAKRRLQEEMGQTGDEAGRVDVPPRQKLYVGTSKSFNINAYLNSDGETIHSEHSDWDTLGYDRSDIRRAISTIDAGMKPLSRDISVVRFVDSDALGKMLGMEEISGRRGFLNLLSRLQSDDGMKRNFTDMLRGVDYVHKAYTSTSYTKDHPSYNDRDIKLNIVAKRGSSAIVTNNDAEHEILLGRGAKYNFTGNYRVETVTTSDGRRKKQLVLDVEI